MPRALIAISACSAAAVLGAGLSGGPLLMRDAVSTPRSFLTDAALGLGETPARAVPQDGLLAVASTVLPGSVVVVVITWIALALAGIGAGLLAGRIVGGGWAPQCAAGLVAVWNPYVAERIMQGQWSLMAGYAAIPWILLAAQRIRDAERGGWPLLWAAVVGAGLTPSGSILAVFAAGAALVVPSLWRGEVRRALAAISPLFVGALPWVVATALNPVSTTSDPAATRVFALRAEPGLGRMFTALGMGGIWNADAVPASRTTWWAGIATAVLLAVVVVGWRFVLRGLDTPDSQARRALDHRRDGGLDRRVDGAPDHRMDGAPDQRMGDALDHRRDGGLDRRAVVAAALAVATVVLVVFASTAPGLATMTWLIEHVPGAGLLRDTQKFLALLMPAVAIGVAGAVRAVQRILPRGFAFAAVAMLIVAPLPDAALRLHPVGLPSDWHTVARLVPADEGAVALWPGGMMRDYSFAPTQSLDPARRLLRAPVLETGELVVDGQRVDAAPTTRAAQVQRALEQGAGPADLAAEGVGWLLVEEPSRNRTPTGFVSATPVFAGDYLTLYRVPNPVIEAGASSARRAIVLVAHLVWLIALVGAVGLVVSRCVASRRAPRLTRQRRG
ncbi:hypothetical protein HUN08_17275 [Gordonia sp. X0973]|uniref:hypothetical protein n=1 Tax=Gordonia sp. X0973 TaxID=2742602 RepID=UPI000F53CB0A|nr:hypothetical protein [Gordonia sp. X0973]QKT08757.1 hypothetical protein HUN08_17275 [Gordonia sp. X0973]